MPKFKNTGTFPIEIGGVLLRPGTVSEVSDKAFEDFCENPAGKKLCKENLKKVGESDAPKAGKAADAPKDEDKGDEKADLLVQAEKLGLKVNKNFGIPKLKEMIAEAGKAADAPKDGK